jgi:hypothetical protein
MSKPRWIPLDAWKAERPPIKAELIDPNWSPGKQRKVRKHAAWFARKVAQQEREAARFKRRRKKPEAAEREHRESETERERRKREAWRRRQQAAAVVNSSKTASGPQPVQADFMKWDDK